MHNSLSKETIDRTFTGVKGLCIAILALSLRDLYNAVKDPFRYQKYLNSQGDSIENVIRFWKEDAYGLLKFVFGEVRAQKSLDKISSLISSLEAKLLS